MQSDIKSLKDGQANLEQGQAITNSRLDEHYQILRALEHASTVYKADIDNLTHQVAELTNILHDLDAFFTSVEQLDNPTAE
ncbi:MAG: hypothetical protein PHG94_03960 [Syntrophomonas sp.]|uniref:hypothetical protein n=1 Tax=Syntrophomonas sp. TaxID=2053627 RepID=UPI00260B71AE|nr:hypothetical protein [Syntrophomonas sp.]MDD2510269.1 hypothetical protein [Syntrophomonas sp.]MDD4627028.1 hypothetical protein [Syntrophomonas sp.]